MRSLSYVRCSPPQKRQPNTQDTNRDGVANWCNEQALREVYARPFELAVKDGNCTGLMTELGRIGTSWSGATYALCTVLPRDEWGMEGKVITDGVGPGGSYYMLPDYALRAGNDMMLTKASGDCGFTSATLKSGYGVTKMKEAARISCMYTRTARDRTCTNIRRILKLDVVLDSGRCSARSRRDRSLLVSAIQGMVLQ